MTKKEKQRTRELTYQAINRGELVEKDECERCGIKRYRLLIHHDDYSDPLNVRWLCAPCHQFVHMEMRTLAVEQ